MTRLPVIVGFGGINPAGRTSGHHGYRRLILDKLSTEKADLTYRSLAQLMGLDPNGLNDALRERIRQHTLIRRLETNLFDADSVYLHKPANLLASEHEPFSFTVLRKHLPNDIPESWAVSSPQGTGSGNDRITVVTDKPFGVMFQDYRGSKVRSGGQLPSGFNPEKLYQSRNHPRGLQLTVYGASDALMSFGIEWEQIRQRVPADQVAVYASSAMGQLDTNGTGGLLQAELLGRRVSSKSLPLGLSEMPADFVNAYILGSTGSTAGNIGACATLLYNLRQGITDIRSGKFRVAVVGASEAPLTPEVIEGYRAMGALAEDHSLLQIEGRSSGDPDFRRACRPFAENSGFTLSEASQFFIIMDDELALEMGATIHGSIADVFVNADGFKKSIPGPGIGNYLTMGKSLGLLRSILGEKAMQENTYVHAHGTGTPQNRVTESHIINELAREFGIARWPVAAIKCYLGHSLACAAGDQIAVSLGIWEEGIIPGIKTIDQIADDVHATHADFLLDHKEVGRSFMKAAVINSKGFGGNNASATILSPDVTMELMQKRHGKKKIANHARLNEIVLDKSQAYDKACIAGETKPIYHFGINVVDGTELKVDSQSITIPGYSHPIDLNLPNPYLD